jgi:flagellar assembly protein FliH
MQSNAARAPDETRPAAYGFDLDLTNPAGKPGAVHGLVPRKDHEAELARARAEARSAGLSEAAAAAEARTAEAAARIADCERLLALADRECETLRRDASLLAIAAGRSLATALIDRQPLAEIETLIESCLGPLRTAPQLVVRLRAEDADALRERLSAIAERAGFTGRLVVLGEENFPAGDCRIEWADGGIVRDRDKAIAAIETTIARHFSAVGGVPREAAAPAPGHLQGDSSDIDRILPEEPADPAKPEPPAGGDAAPVNATALEAVYDVPVRVSAVLGRSRMAIADLLAISAGTVLELDRKVGEAIDVFVNDRLVARGEVVLVEERLGITMTEIIKSDK